MAKGPVTDDTMTMRPHPRSTIPGATACVTLNAVPRFIAISRSHVAASVSRKSRNSNPGIPTFSIPALFTRMSIRPNRSSTAPTIAPACSRSVRSAMNEAASTPPAASSSRRSWIRSLVDVTATAAPSRPSARAHAAPMPVGLPAPVTNATRPATSFSMMVA